MRLFKHALRGAINGDESFAIVLIRLAKTGIREYSKASDEIAHTSTAPYRSTDLWFNWTLLQADGRASEFKRAIRDQLSSRSELHLQVLRVMCETGGRISDKELVDRVRFSMGHRTTAEVLNARNELRHAVCTKITELRRQSR